MFCTNCGKKLDDGAIFCLYCGKKMEVAENGREEVPVERIAETASNLTKEHEEDIPATDNKEYHPVYQTNKQNCFSKNFKKIFGGKCTAVEDWENGFSEEMESGEESERFRASLAAEREALARLESAARTVSEFQNVADWWDKLDTNRGAQGTLS